MEEIVQPAGQVDSIPLIWAFAMLNFVVIESQGAQSHIASVCGFIAASVATVAFILEFRIQSRGLAYILYSNRLDVKRFGRTDSVPLHEIQEIKETIIGRGFPLRQTYRIRCFSGKVYALPKTEDTTRLVKRLILARDTGVASGGVNRSLLFGVKPEKVKWRKYESDYAPYELSSKRLEEWKRLRTEDESSLGERPNEKGGRQ